MYEDRQDVTLLLRIELLMHLLYIELSGARISLPELQMSHSFFSKIEVTELKPETGLRSGVFPLEVSNRSERSTSI